MTQAWLANLHDLENTHSGMMYPQLNMWRADPSTCLLFGLNGWHSM